MRLMTVTVLSALMFACGSAGATSATSHPSSAPSATAVAQTALTVPAALAITDTDKVDLIGSSVPGASISVTWTGGIQSVGADGGGSFVAHVTGLDVGDTTLRVLATANGQASPVAIVLVTRSVSPTAYKASAASLPYPQLEKDPASLAGKILTYTGQVVQYDSATTTSHMRVNVTADGYGYFSDTVWLNVDSAATANIFRDNHVRFWGTVVGPYTYTTTSGGQVTIPEITALYIEAAP